MSKEGFNKNEDKVNHTKIELEINNLDNLSWKVSENLSNFLEEDEKKLFMKMDL